MHMQKQIILLSSRDGGGQGVTQTPLPLLKKKILEKSLPKDISK